LKYYVKLITLITFALLIFACSNEKNTADQKSSSQVKQENVKKDDSKIDPDAIEHYDFRKAKWGMSMKEVRESEDSDPVLESDNTLDYSTFILGLQTQIGYTFYNDELIRGGFFFLTKLDNNNKYVDKYLKIKEELIKVNGEPVIDTELPKDPYKTIAPEDKGDAVCNGDLLYAAQWNLPNTDIQLTLRGENSECKITVLYQSDESVRQLLKERMKNE